MSDTMLHEVRTIAERTREDFESGRIQVDHLLKLGGTYLPDQADKWERSVSRVSAALEIFPALCCELATTVLRHRVGFGNIVQGRYDINSHAYLDLDHSDLPDHTIGDITADQFGGPSIYVGPLRDPWGTKQDAPAYLAARFRQLVRIEM